MRLRATRSGVSNRRSVGIVLLLAGCALIGAALLIGQRSGPPARVSTPPATSTTALASVLGSEVTRPSTSTTGVPTTATEDDSSTTVRGATATTRRRRTTSPTTTSS